MPCFPRRVSSTRGGADALVALPPDVHTLASNGSDGEIVLTPPPQMARPVVAHWSADVPRTQQSADTLRAVGLRPGWYSVHVQDAHGRVSGAVNVHVAPANVPAIVRYDVEHASSDFALDGAVTAMCVHCDTAIVLLWSNGAVTRGPTLRHVRPGTYAAWIVENNGERVSVCTHRCAPAEVDVRE